MMKKEQKEWEVRREEAIKSQSYRPIDATKIRLNIPTNEIKTWLKKNKSEVSFDSAKDNLKSAIYLKKRENKKKELLLELFMIDNRNREQFPKLFWEEYVYGHDNVYDDSTHKEYIERVKRLNDIKDLLDKNKKLQGMTGEEQNGSLGFSWRAWGALMAAYTNTKEKKRKYHYMDFYM